MTFSYSELRLPLQPMHLAVAVFAAVVTTFKAISMARAHATVRDLSTGQIACCFFFSAIIFACAMAKALLYGKEEPKPAAKPSGAAVQGGAAVVQEGGVSAENLGYLYAWGEFGIYMLLFYLVDRTDIFTRTHKHYDRDQFWFLWVVLVLVGLSTVHKNFQKTPSVVNADGSTSLPVVAAPSAVEEHPMPLQRDQTEEWKGWMQIMFLWYHYFEAKELYNAIRLYIAAYVWMTGFGNFSYYYIKKDFSLKRFAQMMWRLNFFVFFACAVLENSYMLYYICMLHTAFTVFIYASLGIKSDLNTDSLALTVKFVLLSVLVLSIWHVPGIFEVVWWPFKWLCMYKGSMHEWKFRSTLDHLVWIVGMLTAYNFPRMDSVLKHIETGSAARVYAIKGSVLAACAAIGYYYYISVFSLGKYEYNALHPYTSFVPITLYITLRNLSKRARQYHMHLFAFLGKITLETYIGQFHIWMVTTGPDYTRLPDAAPKRLLMLLPEGWPMVNFVLVSVLYLAICYRIFKITVNLRSMAVPDSCADNSAVLRNLVAMPVTVALVYSLAWGMKLIA